MSEKRDPWSKFYWSDWQADELLGCVSLGARALWVEMLAIAHKATPQGYILLNGHSPDDATLARVARCTVAEVRKHKAELERAGVPTIEDGIWHSRRMVRDARRRAVNRANGAEGGNPRLLDNQPAPKSDNQTESVRITEPVKPADKSHDARDPEARSQKPEGGQSSIPVSVAARASDDLEIPAFLRAKALHPKALGLLVECTDASPDWLAFRALTAMLESGATDAEILDACRAAAAQKAAHPLRSWAYVAAIVETNRTRRKADVETEQAQAQRSADRVAAVVARQLARLGPRVDGVPGGDANPVLPPASG